MKSAKHIPEGHAAVSPYLTSRGAAALIEFLKAAFDARVGHVTRRPGGEIGHAEVSIGGGVLMISEASADWPERPSAVHLYLPDVDAAYDRALKAGAESVMAPADQYYGDRSGGVRDASGNLWWIATHVEDVSPEELSRREAARAKK
jgi:PhnB protein